MTASSRSGPHQEVRVNCPNCGHEIPESAERCPACNLELAGIPDDAGADPLPDELVTVLESGDPTLIPVVRSLLEAEGIHCVVENEMLQDMMGGGRFGMGFNPVVGPVHVRVAPEDEEAARALLAHHVESLENEPTN
jgi:hypothetical protein